MASTELGSLQHAGADAAFRLARRAFLAGERIDMQRLAAELGVNRVTLYRWVGNRGRLLGEVAWELADALIRVSEACIYLDLLVDQHPDLDRVARMIRAVIH